MASVGMNDTRCDGEENAKKTYTQNARFKRNTQSKGWNI